MFDFPGEGRCSSSDCDWITACIKVVHSKVSEFGDFQRSLRGNKEAPKIMYSLMSLTEHQDNKGAVSDDIKLQLGR